MLKVDPQDKAKLIDPLFAPLNLRFKLTAGVLLAIIGWGAFMYVRQLLLGLGVTGMGRPVYWSTYIVNFVFFIGISHAGTLISAILRVTGAEWRRPVTRVAEAITVFALIVGSLQIIIDMGRADRLPFAILFGRLQSPILWDITSVTLYLLGSVTYLFLPLMPDLAILRDNLPDDAPAWRRQLYTALSLGWRGTREQWLRLERAIASMAVIIIPIAVSVHSIISWILATTLQPGWHSTIFGPYFVIGAIFSGIGALFIAMTAVRKALKLEDYITRRQYRNLGLLFIAMNALWFYFTFTENLGIAAGQQTHEFPVLAAKIWGEFAPAFWGMVALMLAAFWVMVAPQLMPTRVTQVAFFTPRYAFAAAATAAVVLLLTYAPIPIGFQAALGDATTRTVLLAAAAAMLIAAGVGVLPWLKRNPTAAWVIAAVCVVIGMWLERWNIVIPTMTHAMMIPYASYRPTLTEVSITLASLAGFVLMFLVFFKLFPSVSIWEFAEGRVIEEAQAQIVLPEPEPNERRLRRWGVRQASPRA